MKISVVIPVYNVERYLKACLDSVFAAARNLMARRPGDTAEIICIDDGSTDSSGAMLDDQFSTFNLQPSTFRIIHQANAGVSAARNRGMDEATGDLIAFLDSDDTFHPRAFEIIAMVWSETGAEVLRYDWRLVETHGGGSAELPLSPVVRQLDFGATEKSPFREARCGAFTVVNRRLADLVRWPPLAQCEDPLFLLRCFRESRKTVQIDMQLADYLIHRGSASHEVTLKIVESTCVYLPLAFDECRRYDSFARFRDDAVAFVRGFLEGPLDGRWKGLAKSDRTMAERARVRMLRTLALLDSAFGMPKAKEHYDLVFALGSACLATQTLRASGLQYATFPLDWIYGMGMRGRAELVAEDFAGWMEPADFEPIDNPNAFGHDPYRNRKTGMDFPHDFEKGVPFASSFAAVKAKYDRRIGRFQKLVASAKEALVVWVGDPRDEVGIADDEIEAALGALSRRFPGTEFHLIVLECDRSRTIAERAVHCGLKHLSIAFDYHLEGGRAFAFRPELLTPVFSGFESADYRSSEEKCAYARMEREREFARFGVSSRLGLWWARKCHKLRKHFSK